MNDLLDISISQLCVKILGGGTPPRTNPNYWDGPIPWASVKDFEDNTIRLSETKERITESGLLNSASNLISPNTPIICTRMAVGRISLTQVPTAINQDVKAFQLADGQDPLFFVYAMKLARPNLEALAIGSTVKGVSLSDIARIKIKSLPLPEQHLIAKILDTLDTAIRRTEDIIAKLQKVKVGLLHDLLTRGVDESGQLRPRPEDAPYLYKDSPLGKIPKEWEVKKLNDDFIEIEDGDRGSNYPNGNDFSKEGYCLFLNTGNVLKDRFDFEDVSFITLEKSEKLRKGKIKDSDIVMTTRGTVGHFAFVDKVITYPVMRINSGMVILRIRNHDLITPKFFFDSFARYHFDLQFTKLRSGSAQPQLPIKDLRQFAFVIPKNREQKLIGESIIQIVSKITMELQQLRKIRLQKQGLMNDLLTGKVRVTDLLKQEAV